MEQQHQFDVIHDAVSQEVVMAPRPAVKIDNRAYVAAALGSWVEAVQQPVAAVGLPAGPVQPIPETLAVEYLDLLG